MGASGSKAGDPTPLAAAHSDDSTTLQQVRTLGHTSPVCFGWLGFAADSTAKHCREQASRMFNKLSACVCSGTPIGVWETIGRAVDACGVCDDTLSHSARQVGSLTMSHS